MVGNKIILKGSNPKNKVIDNMTEYAEKYNRLNYGIKKNKILFKEEQGKIYVVVPWNLEHREFKGRVYETNGQTCIEGRFILIEQYIYCRVLGWGVIGMALISLFISIQNISILFFSKEALFVLACIVLLFIFDIMWMLKYRNEKYENRVLDFLTKCLNNYNENGLNHALRANVAEVQRIGSGQIFWFKL